MCNKQDQSNCLSQVSGGCLRPSLGKVGVIMVLNNPRPYNAIFLPLCHDESTSQARSKAPHHLASQSPASSGEPLYHNHSAMSSAIWDLIARDQGQSAAFQILLRMFMKGLPCVGYFRLDLRPIIVWPCQYPSFRLIKTWSMFDNRLSWGHIDDDLETNWWQLQDNIILVYWYYHFHLKNWFLQIHWTLKSVVSWAMLFRKLLTRYYMM